MAAEGEKKLITLKSSDGEEFEVEEAVAMESQTIRHMIEDDCADNGIPLPNVNSKILSKVIEYCNKHVHAAAAASKAANPSTDGDANSAAAANNSAAAASGEDLKNWDADFVKVDQATLFYLIQCKVCMQTFMCITSEVKCREHAEAKHPKSDVYHCFPHLKK